MAVTHASMALAVGMSGGMADNTSTLLDPITQQIAKRYLQEYTLGTGANQFNERSSSVRSATIAGETIDLNAGTLLSDFRGTPIVFTSIKGFVIVNRSTTTGQYIFFTGAGNQFLMRSAASPQVTSIGSSGTIFVQPGGIWVMTSPIDGFDCSLSTKDQIIVNGIANGITWDLVVWGVA